MLVEHLLEAQDKAFVSKERRERAALGGSAAAAAAADLAGDDGDIAPIDEEGMTQEQLMTWYLNEMKNR